MSVLFDQFMKTMVDAKVGEGLACVAMFLGAAFIIKFVLKYIV